MANMSQPTSRGGRLLWSAIFPDAMALFQARSVESAAMQKSKFRIRSQQDWNGVDLQLQAAQESYIHATGFKGWMRMSRRAVADNSQVAVQASKLVPAVDMTAPVVNVVQSLFEVSLVVWDGLTQSYQRRPFKMQQRYGKRS